MSSTWKIDILSVGYRFYFHYTNIISSDVVNKTDRRAPIPGTVVKVVAQHTIMCQ